MIRRWLPLLLDILAGGLFVYAGVVKASNPADFMREIDNYRLLSTWLASGVATYLPWLEVICGLAVMTGAWRESGRCVLVILMIVFMTALTTAWWRGLDIRCGCFGAGGSSTAQIGYGYLYMRDVGILAALCTAGLLRHLLKVKVADS